MASPFPGMDPYLESPEIWRGFHHHLAEEITKQLNPRIVPKYYADVEVHAVVQEIGIAKNTTSMLILAFWTDSPNRARHRALQLQF